MKAFYKIIQNPAFQVGILLMLIKYFFDSFKKGSKNNNSNSLSTNFSVQSLINIIDTSLDKFGTFNKDHKIIFESITKLSSLELKLLHKDFGTRAYNPISRQYGFSNGFFISSHKDLNSLFLSEFDENQIIQLKSIYTFKGLEFPMIN